jgi:hypothetical protein
MYNPRTLPLVSMIPTSPKPFSISKIAQTSICFFVAVFLTSCASAEERKRQRQQQLEGFAGRVVQHLLDRNPATYRRSIASLMREELDDSTISNLQSIGRLPEPGLEEMKFISDAEDQKTSNKVETPIVRAVGDMSKDVVPMRVTGKVTNYKDGTKTDDRSVQVEVDCRLTEAMDGYPKAVGVRGLDPVKSVAKQTDNNASPRSKKRAKRRG